MIPVLVIIGAAVILAIPGVYLVLRGARGAGEDSRISRRLAALGGDYGYRQDIAADEGAREPRFGWLASLAVGGEKDRKEIGTHLRLAGWYSSSAVVTFALLRLGGALLTILIVAVGIRLQLGPLEGLRLAYPFLAGGAVYVLAKRVLVWFGNSRLRRIRREMPFILDIMMITLESGLSLDQSLRHIALSETSAGPEVQKAVRVLVDDLEKGTPYDVALDKWGERLGIDEGRELAALFKQSLHYGTEIGPSLREFIREFSDKRVSTARESIGRKATQLTGVMVVFFLPALLIILAGPTVTALLSGLSRMTAR